MIYPLQIADHIATT